MKNHLYFTFSILILCAITNLYLPWWFTAIICGFCSYKFNLKSLEAFAIGFGTISVLWTTLASIQYFTYSKNIVGMISNIFMDVGADKLIYITGLIGGITAGLGSLTGSVIKQNFFSSEE
jgi:hypothetical protein